MLEVRTPIVIKALKFISWMTFVSRFFSCMCLLLALVVSDLGCCSRTVVIKAAAEPRFTETVTVTWRRAARRTGDK